MYDDRDGGYPLLDFINEQLSGLTDALEDLTFAMVDNEYEDPAFSWAIEHSTYQDFTKLRRLEIPHPFLTGEVVALPLTQAAHILPASLEELVITHIDEEISDIWDMVDGIALTRRQQGAFPNLNEVRLPSASGPLDAYNAEYSVKKLQKVGIEVYAWLEDNEDGDRESGLCCICLS